MLNVNVQWNTIEFIVKQYKDFKDVYVLGSVDDVMAALEDSMVTMNTVTSSRFAVYLFTCSKTYGKFCENNSKRDMTR